MKDDGMLTILLGLSIGLAHATFTDQLGMVGRLLTLLFAIFWANPVGVYYCK
jgi:multisubunit Na+/H+ antiporter MnhG subunit